MRLAAEDDTSTDPLSKRRLTGALSEPGRGERLRPLGPQSLVGPILTSDLRNGLHRQNLYGDKTPIAALRAQFFNCRQGHTQSIRSFALQLRELFVRLRNRDDHGLGNEDALMWDQFLLGLRDGPMRQCLKTQLRRDPALTYEAIWREALTLELDQQEADEQSIGVAVATSSACAPTPSSATDWKRELHTEIMKDVKAQMAELSRTLLEELRWRRSSSPPPPGEGQFGRHTRAPCPQAHHLQVPVG
ncbi:hypothetical protein ACEWY4_008539 [Coilia grayii]|uniref:Retrotransposon gag domain-containing protein n=1 Tax=Coilia grayii TaxID=363190 RepID=A0ABD1KBI8_9TELE